MCFESTFGAVDNQEISSLASSKWKLCAEEESPAKRNAEMDIKRGKGRRKKRS
jgi:hypothetical protein